MSKRYDLEHIQVQVTWEEFLPTGKEFPPEKAVLFLPGWPLKEAPAKSMRRIGEEFANNFGARTYLIYTQSKQIVTHPMYHHAQAVCKFLAELAEKGIKSIILSGLSQGGLKAIDTVVRLQEMELGIRVEGLVLINSAGLNDIDEWTLLWRQFVDLTVKIFLIILRESAREPSLRKKITSLRENMIVLLRGAGDFFFSIRVDARPSLRTFFSRFKNEVVETATRSPYLDQLSVPIVIIQGTKDRCFDTDRILTQAKAQTGTSEVFDARVKSPPVFSKAAKKQNPVEDLFPRSPYVRLVRGQKFGNHLLPLFQPGAVAQASLYVLGDSKEVLDLPF